MDLNNESNLFIPESLMNNENLSNYSLAVYCVLHMLSIPTHMPIQCVTQQQIEFYLTGKLSGRRVMNDCIKCGINELINCHIVEKLEESKKHIVLDCTNIRIDTEKVRFVKLTFNEVQQIFQAENVNNFTLLKYFCFLVGTISSKINVYLNGECKNRVVGNFTIEYLSTLSGISERSIVDYNKILEKLGLLYIFRQQDFVIDKENNIRLLPNIYGRPCDIKYIKTFATNQKKYLESYRYVKNDAAKANNKRRLAQMYQQLLKGGGIDYTEREIIDIYNYVVSENQKYERLYDKRQSEEYLDKIRDTEIFKQFPFINIKEE